MTDEFTLQCNMQWFDVVRLLKSYGYDSDNAETVADYLTACIDYEINLTSYIGNILPYYVHIFENKEDMDKYLEDESIGYDDIKWYKCDNENYYVERI